MNSVLTTVIQRLALGLITLFFVSIIIFAMVSMLPGDFTQAVLGQAALEETVEAFRKELGLDQPAHIRYIQWLGGVLQGDFGTSFSGRASSGVDRSRSVAELIEPRLFNTLFLAAMTAIVAVPLALYLGITAALHRNGFFDRMINSVTLVSISLPEFLVAYVFMALLAVLQPIFPPISEIRPDATFFDRIYISVLPALTLTMVTIAHMMRMTRAAIINLLASPYVEMARLKGVAQREIIVKHVLPNAWAPIATVIAFNLAYLVIGVVVVETVFTYPGIGRLMVDSVTTRDMPIVQACGLIFAGTYILLNMTADIIGIVTNPRLLHPR